MNQERNFDSHRRVLVCRGFREMSNQFFHKEYKVHVSKTLTRRKDVYLAFYCTYTSKGEKCRYILRILGNGQEVMLSIITVSNKHITIKFLLQRDAVYVEEGEHIHPPDRLKMMRALMTSMAKDQIEAGITSMPRELFTETCESNGYVTKNF
jgi:hypothetical protein